MSGLSFFLGANTYRGFYSLYEEYLSVYPVKRVWILKGGAGCGKSGLMRRVAQRAEEAGHAVYRILCSGDPASLDGVHIPELETLLFDGTAPHILEPPQVGHRGFYLDLSRFYRAGVPELAEREAVYKLHYRKAYSWLAAAGNLDDPSALPQEALDAIRRKARSLVSRELRRKDRSRGTAKRFFTDAFTGDGLISLPDSLRFLAPRQIGLQGFSGAEHAFLAEAAETALSRGWDAVICPDPLRPERIAHLLIPEAGLGLGVGQGDRQIHLDRLVYANLDREEATGMRETEAMRFALLSRAQKELVKAKYHHDRLEEAVNSFVDFNGVYALAEEAAEKLLSSET